MVTAIAPAYNQILQLTACKLYTRQEFQYFVHTYKPILEADYLLTSVKTRVVQYFAGKKNVYNDFDIGQCSFKKQPEFTVTTDCNIMSHYMW